MTKTTFTDDAGDVRFSGVIRMGGTAGQVATVQANGTLAPAAGGGGSSPILHVAFPFAFNTPGLVTGVSITGWTPAVGDVILDGWPEVTTAWDGTTPFADVFLNGADPVSGGLFSLLVAGEAGYPLCDMTVANTPTSPGCGLVASGNWRLLSGMAGTAPTFTLPGTLDSGAGSGPAKLYLNTTGKPGGSDPGAAQGAAIMHLLILQAP